MYFIPEFNNYDVPHEYNVPDLECEGWIREEDVPDLELLEKILINLRKQSYDGDIEKVENSISDICDVMDLDFDIKKSKLLKVKKMENKPVLKEIPLTSVQEIEQTTELCKKLMQTPYYKKVGGEGIFAIVESAKSLGISPLKALNGGMYFVKGKVEMSSRLMNSLIRSKKHSITKDKRSNDTVCILHGKRADNGDTWTESFSIEEAKKAGIYQHSWIKFPRDMLFARALSRLARQLFPDVIQDCYVEGEISLDSDINEEKEEVPTNGPLSPISEEQYSELEEALIGLDDLRERILSFIDKEYGRKALSLLPQCLFERVIFAANNEKKNKETIQEEAV